MTQPKIVVESVPGATQGTWQSVNGSRAGEREADLFSDLGNSFRKATHDTVDAAKHISERIPNTAKDIGNDISNATKPVVDDVSSTTKSVSELSPTPLAMSEILLR